jgi:hypothetical protein
MEINALIPSGVQAQVNGEIKALLEGSKIESITDKLQRENLGELVKALARHRVYLESERVKAKEPHLEAGRAVDKYFNPIIDGLKDIESYNGRLCLTYDKAEFKKIEDARIEAARVAQAERNRLAAIEAKKREESERLVRETAEKAKQAEKAKGAEKARLEAERIELERKANAAFEAANKKEEQAAAVQIVPVLDTYSAPKGLSGKVTYKVNVKDHEAFIRACVAQEKFHWLAIEEGLVNKEITANKGKWKFPGAEVIEETGTRVNTRMKE